MRKWLYLSEAGSRTCWKLSLQRRLHCCTVTRVLKRVELTCRRWDRKRDMRRRFITLEQWWNGPFPEHFVIFRSCEGLSLLCCSSQNYRKREDSSMANKGQTSLPQAVHCKCVVFWTWKQWSSLPFTWGSIINHSIIFQQLSLQHLSPIGKCKCGEKLECYKQIWASKNAEDIRYTLTTRFFVDGIPKIHPQCFNKVTGEQMNS